MEHYFLTVRGSNDDIRAYESAAAQSMEPWAATEKALHQCGGDSSSCPGPYPKADRPEFHVGYWLGREPFTLSS